MEDTSGRLVSYIISHTIAHANRLPKNYEDPIHEAFNHLDDNSLYVDQLFLKKEQPINFAMRLVDAWDYIAQNEVVLM